MIMMIDSEVHVMLVLSCTEAASTVTHTQTHTKLLQNLRSLFDHKLRTTLLLLSEKHNSRVVQN
jgi:hypothetical protein